MVACSLGGGVGVGWTYLALVVAIGHGFKHHPLAGSAIGPVGFSFGTATVHLLSKNLAFSTRDAEQLGHFLGLAGVVFVVVGRTTVTALPQEQRKVRTPSTDTFKRVDSTERGWRILLFPNAFPGMAIFAVFQLLTSHQLGATVIGPRFAPMVVLGALACGGLAAPTLNAKLGASGAFSLLLAVRGILLVISWHLRSTSIAVVALAAAFFGHGAGFNILPVLIQQRAVSPERFVDAYSRVLVAWGLAGMASTVMNGLLMVIVGDPSLVSLASGITALVGIPFLCTIRIWMEERGIGPNIQSLV